MTREQILCLISHSRALTATVIQLPLPEQDTHR
jgi:hypothetical protein